MATRDRSAIATDDPHGLKGPRAADAIEPLEGPTINSATIESLIIARHGDPFGVLGPHLVDGTTVVRALLPSAVAVEVIATDREDGSLGTLTRIHHDGLFEGAIATPSPTVSGAPAYRLRITWPAEGGGTTVQEVDDPYAFGPLLGALDLHLIAEGRHHKLGESLGGRTATLQTVPGARFAVWAPNAQRVSVIGDFNGWDGRRHAMRRRVEAGVWELFIPALEAGARYQYEIVGAHGGLLPLKADPVALSAELPPGTASRVADSIAFTWTDDGWMGDRAARHAPDAPLSIYEVHAGSWIRNMDVDAEHGGHSFDWNALSERLIPYAKSMGFTHLEFLPVMEHPFGGSWGYQPLGLFAPTARFGTPADFARFVDRCHAAGLGVILDWVPAHFPSDAHGLAQFDGSALYEHADPREGFHQDWNTLIFNFGRNEVRGFLIASALEWLERYHVDGLRVDAVASMLYRDYSRKAGEWVPNIHGGRENLEAVAFLKELNTVVAERCPSAMMIAEESTAWPGVTAPVSAGGLGFSYKWNMGWMHDTLRYIEEDPINRQWHHDDMTFGMVYAYSERFVLPISHDEVVHGKGSLIRKMPGDDWQKHANLRAYLAFMWTHPGKKLLFMGCEIGDYKEWNHDGSLDWNLLDQPRHRGLQHMLRDLNHLYAGMPALHEKDCDPTGFAWIVGDDRTNSVFAFRRMGRGDGSVAIVVANMTPVVREGYRIGVPFAGEWRERFNSDAADYGGSGTGNQGTVHARDEATHGLPASVALTLPPLGLLILELATPA
ncbi:MAG: 1,4-alpha-glucan branching protein GlgB [Burkholderiaceae bacterium]